MVLQVKESRGFEGLGYRNSHGMFIIGAASKIGLEIDDLRNEVLSDVIPQAHFRNLENLDFESRLTGITKSSLETPSETGLHSCKGAIFAGSFLLRVVDSLNTNL